MNIYRRLEGRCYLDELKGIKKDGLTSMGDGWMGGWVDMEMSGWVSDDRWVDGWMDGWMDG